MATTTTTAGAEWDHGITLKCVPPAIPVYDRNSVASPQALRGSTSETAVSTIYGRLYYVLENTFCSQHCRISTAQANRGVGVSWCAKDALGHAKKRPSTQQEARVV